MFTFEAKLTLNVGKITPFSLRVYWKSDLYHDYEDVKVSLISPENKFGCIAFRKDQFCDINGLLPYTPYSIEACTRINYNYVCSSLHGIETLPYGKSATFVVIFFLISVDRWQPVFNIESRFAFSFLSFLTKWYICIRIQISNVESCSYNSQIYIIVILKEFLF